MKKLLTSLTALALVSAMVVPVAAFADVRNGDNQDYNGTEFTKTYTATYVVTIPSSITVGTAAQVSIDSVDNLYGTIVTVTAPTNFNIYKGGDVQSNDKLVVNPLSGYGSVAFSADSETFGTVNFAVTSGTPIAGVYSGTASFTVSSAVS